MIPGANLSLTNLAGLWALLGIPVILAIHFIQQKHRREEISTLFLLALSPEPAISRKRLNWLRSSWQLLAQLLAVLLLAFILSGPEILHKAAAQRVVIILDGSFSMHAVKEKLPAVLEKVISESTPKADYTEFVLADTILENDALYHGANEQKLMDALHLWVPQRGAHDVEGNLRALKDIYSNTSQFIFISDHEPGFAFDARVISLGEEVNNWGLVGLRLEGSGDDLQFAAVLKNFSSIDGSRHWWIESEGKKSEAREVNLRAGQYTTLRAALPAGLDRLEIAIEPDAYKLDDRLPIIRPVPQVLNAYVARGDVSAKLWRLFSSIRNVTRVNKPEDADFEVVSFRDAMDGATFNPRISFYISDSATGDKQLFTLTPERAGLLQYLNWSTVRIAAPASVEIGPADEVLLWADEHPAVVLRSGEIPHLIVAFDIRRGNALNSPAFILLLDRFCEQLRRRSQSFVQDNYELAEQLPLPPLETASSLPTKTSQDWTLTQRAPLVPSFFSLKKLDKDRLTGAAHYAEATESDFRSFRSFDRDRGTIAGETAKQAVRRNLAELFLVVLIVVLLCSWSSRKTLKELQLR